MVVSNLFVNQPLIECDSDGEAPGDQRKWNCRLVVVVMRYQFLLHVNQPKAVGEIVWQLVTGSRRTEWGLVGGCGCIFFFFGSM